MVSSLILGRLFRWIYIISKYKFCKLFLLKNLKFFPIIINLAQKFYVTLETLISIINNTCFLIYYFVLYPALQL